MDNEQNNDALEAAFHAAPPSVSHSLACPRCGNFVRELLPGLEACEACVEKVLPEGVRGPLNFSTVANGAWHLVRRIGPMSAVLALALQLPGSVLFAFVPNVPFQAQMLYGLITLFGDLIILGMAYDALLGRPVAVGASASRAVSRYGAVFGARWISNIATAFLFLLLILPGIYMGLSASLAEPIALFESHSGGTAFAASRERTKGHLLLLLVTFGGPILMGLTWTFGMGMIIGIVQELQAQAGATDDLSWLAWLGVVGDIGMSLCMLLATFVQAVVYTKTWLELQARLAAEEPVGSLRVHAVRTERDALDEKLDRELAKLD
jgi:hypothetical protein